MDIQPWQVPVVVMAVVACPAVVAVLFGVIRREPPEPEEERTEDGTWWARLEPAQRRKLKALFWGVLGVASLVVAFLSVGGRALEILGTAISAVSALVSTVIAVQNGQLAWRDQRPAGDSSGTDARADRASS